MANRRIYDFRIKKAIILSGNPRLFPHLNIPLSTAKSWIRRGIGEVITDEFLDMSQIEMAVEISDLKAEVKKNGGLLELRTLVNKAAGFSIQYKRFGSEVKEKILKAINHAKISASLELVLKSIGLSSQRYNQWIGKQKKCELKNYNSCPKLTPSRLLPKEVAVIKNIVEDNSYSHYSLTSLWLLAWNQQKIFVSLSTWFRYIRKYEFRRPTRIKKYKKPKHGLRADSPNQILQIDVSVVIYNNIRAYTQCIRDNFSRYILAYSVSDKIGGLRTKNLMIEAIKKAQEFGYFDKTTFISDKGPENVNKDVKSLVEDNIIDHLIARLNIIFSNSTT